MMLRRGHGAVCARAAPCPAHGMKATVLHAVCILGVYLPLPGLSHARLLVLGQQGLCLPLVLRGAPCWGCPAGWQHPAPWQWLANPPIRMLI